MFRSTDRAENCLIFMQTMCTSVVDISNGKAKPVPRRLVLTGTHILVQKNSKDADDTDSNRPTHGSVSDRGFSGGESFDSYADTTSPPPENNVRNRVGIQY
ncbi:unnamed protein product [Allacma fusca]|uniref:Uncharacterized protein n=1 Tax=Allacma fusca TaxID=39272 RepID=A0A8J2PBH6_9HEXA|nr:unnamed protein product [Allacma fusca]